VFIVKARDPVLEERGREPSLGEEQNDNLNNVKSDDEECSKCPSRLIWDASIVIVIAVLVILINTVSDSLNILSQYDNICDEHKEERDHGQAAKGIENEKLGLGAEGKHGQQ